MNHSLPLWRGLLASLALFAGASLAGAQTNLGAQLPLPTATPPPRQGLLGATYALLDMGVVQERHGNGRTYGPTVGVNLAVTDNTDVTTTVGYAKQRKWPTDGNLYQLGADWNFHLNLGQWKPFVVAGLGYQFSRAASDDDFGLWNAGAGVEYVVAPRTALTLKAVDTGAFSRSIASAWQYSFSASHWLQHHLAVTAGVTFVENQAIGYTIGVRWGF